MVGLTQLCWFHRLGYLYNCIYGIFMNILDEFQFGKAEGLIKEARNAK